MTMNVDLVGQPAGAPIAGAGQSWCAGLLRQPSNAALDAKENVVVALAPDLQLALPTEEWAELGANVTVEIDPALAPATCEVRSRTGLAKVSAAARMEQMKTALGAHEERS